MKTVLRVGAILVLLVTCAWAGANLNLSKSNINRLSRATLVSVSTTFSGAVSQIVYSTPSSGDFVLTQVCTGTSNGGVLVQIGGVSIAQVASGNCQTFPGLLLPPDQSLTCTSFDAEATNNFCTITGLLGPAAPQPTPTPRT
jgi:hypothetical protein